MYKHFDSKCVKIDAICANFILTLIVGEVVWEEVTDPGY